MLRRSLTLLGPDEHRSGGTIPAARAGRAVPGVTISIRDVGGSDRYRRRTTARCALEVATSCASTGTNPQPPSRPSTAAGTAPATRATSTSDGYLYLVDRVKDMIVTGGENVYSIEVENALASHPAVAQVAVIGIPDAKWGEAVHAIVVTRDGAAVTFDELVDHDARLASPAYKVPKSIEFRTEPLPLSAAMKVLKRELRAPYWAAEERRIS